MPTRSEIEAAHLAAPFEGFSTTPYLCPARVWTYGYGSTRDLNNSPVTQHTPPITHEQAEQLMARDLASAEAEIHRDVKVPLSDEETAALDSFIYNVGAGNFRSSTLLRYLNMGRFDLAADEFPKWDMAKGRVLAGLLRRRQAERAEFLGGDS